MNPRKVIVFIICLMISYQFTTICKANSISDNDGTEYWAFCMSKFESNSVFAIKNVLIENGWKENHIRAIQGENLTKQDFFDGLSWLSENDDSNDISIIYTESHGSEVGLWHDGYYGNYSYYTEISEALNKLDSAGIAVFIYACFSGNAISYLKKDGRVIITAVDSNESGGGKYRNSLHIGLAGLGDYMNDKNGIVSAEEIFTYISLNENMYHPQIQDDYPESLNLVYLKTDDTIFDQMQVYYENSTSYMTAIFPNSFIAQSFVPEINHLTKVKLVVGKDKENTCPVIVSIRDNLSKDDLTYAAVPANNITNTSGSLVEFDFKDINVTPGKTYYIVFRIPCESNEYYRLFGETKDLYDKGKLYQSFNSGTTWETFSSEDFNDLFFVTYGFNLSHNGNNGNGNASGNGKQDETPSFELILVVCAMALILLWKRKRTK